MTEAAQDTTPTLTEVLVRHAFYNQFGIIRIAIDDNTLQAIAGVDTVTVNPQEVTLLEQPGTTDWQDRMIRIRTSLVRDLENVRNDLKARNDHLEALGQALLEEAKSRDWCGEYDTFAEQWDLPQRTTEWEVTATVRVNARTEDDAIEILKDGVSINSYDGPVTHGPTFYATTVD